MCLDMLYWDNTNDATERTISSNFMIKCNTFLKIDLCSDSSKDVYINALVNYWFLLI